MENNANGPGPLRSPTLKAPPSRNMPEIQGVKTVNRDAQGLGTVQIGSRN